MTMQGTGEDKTKLISFIAKGVPEAQARHKHHYNKGKTHKDRNGRAIVYDPSLLQKHDYARAVNAAMVEMEICIPFFKGGHIDTCF